MNIARVFAVAITLGVLSTASSQETQKQEAPQAAKPAADAPANAPQAPAGNAAQTAAVLGRLAARYRSAGARFNRVSASASLGGHRQDRRDQGQRVHPDGRDPARRSRDVPGRHLTS